MTNPFMMPPTGFGPGSQPLEQEDQALEYMPLPQDMRTYSPSIPEVESLEGADLRPALSLLNDVALAAKSVGENGGAKRFSLADLDADNRALVAETLGSGEVAAKVRSIPAIAVQESVFAGIWTLQSAKGDMIEVGAIPTCVSQDAFSARNQAEGDAALKAPGVANAPSLFIELRDKSREFNPSAPLYVVNLSLLPHTEQDLVALDKALGEGSATILSRGYGNCRITATAMPHVWKVQFFNSQDKLILDTYEVTTVPEVACAAPEDLIDSANRLENVLEAIQ